MSQSLEALLVLTGAITLLFLGWAPGESSRPGGASPRYMPGSSSWTDAARELGLDVRGTHATGRIGGLEVATWYQSETVLVAISGLVSNVTLVPATTSADTRRLRTGDPDFDAIVEIRGDTVHLTACLDKEARARIAASIRDSGLYIENGRIRFVAPRWAPSSTIVNGIRAAVGVAAVLDRGEASVDDRLIRCVLSDDRAEVRRQALAMLLDRPDAPLLYDRVKAALEDPDPVVRLMLARTFHSVEHLRGLVDDKTAPVRIRAEALVGVSPLIDTARLVADWRRVLADPDMQDVAVWEDMAEAAVRQLGTRSREEGLEELLIDLLQRYSGRVVVAAIEVLGKVGSPRTARIILAESQEKVPLGPLNDIVRHAVRSIQERHWD